MSGPDAVLARDDAGRLLIRGHAAVTAAALDPATFSSRVSRYPQIPNGLDGEAHARARALIDPFFAPAEVDAVEPALAAIARELVEWIGTGGREFDAVGELGARYAVRAQSAWLGWDRRYEDELLEWVAGKRAATRAADEQALARSAEAFDAIVRRLLAERRDRLHPDATTLLMMLRTHDGRPLADEEIVAILRNWTGGDLVSVALCVGVVVHAVATQPVIAERLRVAPDAELDAVIDEILRLDDPFVSNRRVAAQDVVVAGCPVRAGEVVVLDWRAANRDPAVMGDPDRFDPHGHAAANLVYGIGPHACPGRGLATRELRMLVRALLDAGDPEPAGTPVREPAPGAGFAVLPVRIRPR